MSDPLDSQVTIVGAGAVGAAAAYHLARAGYRDIQILEAGSVSSQTTGQAAGLVGQSRTTLDRSRLTIASAELYRNMERDLGYTADWRETGSIRIALSDTSVAELEQIAAVAKQADLEVELVDRHQVRELCPMLEDVSAVRLALWCPTDGYVQPNSLADAYLNAARNLGVRVVTHTRVVGVDVEDGEITGVTTDRGHVATEMLVNAAGPWAGALARLAGLEMPVVPVLHEYFVTEPQDGWSSASPTLRIPEVQVYIRGEGSGVLCGGFEHNGTSLDPTTVEVDSALPTTPNWDVLGAFASDFARFVPSFSDAGVRTVFQGWPGFTPDGRFIVGPVASLRGFVMAAGCNAHGVSGSAGLAQHLVESLGNDVSPYVASLSPNRFVPRTWEWSEARVQAQAICENYYPMPAQRA